MREAHLFYKNSIFSNQGREALEYLSNRKLNPKVIKENGLGFAPNKWSELMITWYQRDMKAKIY